MESLYRGISIADYEQDVAADVIEVRIRAALATGASLRDACVYAADEVRKLWGLGFTSEDPSLSEPPSRWAVAS